MASFTDFLERFPYRGIGLLLLHSIHSPSPGANRLTYYAATSPHDMIPESVTEALTMSPDSTLSSLVLCSSILMWVSDGGTGKTPWGAVKPQEGQSNTGMRLTAQYLTRNVGESSGLVLRRS
jgi:hypothetical protein